MATEILKNKRNIEDEQGNNNNKRRSLIIGIGGSGKEVLIRLRKLFYETYQDPQGFPFIEFLWIDTDPRNKTIMLDDYDVLTQKVMLKEKDCVNVSIDTPALSTLYKNIESKKNINSWFDKNQMEKLGLEVLKQGASAIRPFGKLAFWHNSEKIKGAIEKKLYNLKKDFHDYANLSAPNDIDVHILGSLAGGTGSGMFLDLGFLLAELDLNLHRNAFLFLSDIFQSVPGNHQERMSNNYAALQELDFFMTPANQYKNVGKTFNFDWFANEPNKIVKLPVFTSCYLIGNTDNDGTVYEDITDPFYMVAEYLFYDFDESDFADQKRSVKTNGRLAIGNRSMQKMVLQKKNRDYVIPISFTNSYFSIGLSEIKLNIRKMRLRSSYKFLKDFFGQVIKTDNERHHDSFYDNDSNFVIENLNFESIISSLKDGKENTSKANRLLSILTNETSKMKNGNKNLINHKNIDRFTEIREEKLNEIDRYFENKKKLFDSKFRNDFNIKGEILDDVKKNSNSLLTDLKRDIFNKIFYYLNMLENNGYTIAKDLLEECEIKIKEISLRQQEIVNEKIIYSRLPHKESDYSQELLKFREDLEDIQEIPVLFLGYKSKATNFVNRKRGALVRRINHEFINELNNYIDKNHKMIKDWFNYQLNNLIKNSFKELISELQKLLFSNADNDSLKEKLFSIKNVVTDFKTYFEDFEKMFITNKKTDIKRQWLLDEYVNFEGKYTSFVDPITDKYQEVVNNVIKKINFKTDYPVEGSLSKLYALFFDWDSISQQIDLKNLFRKESERIFKSFMENTDVSKELRKIYTERKTECIEKIARIKSKAIFRLPLDERKHPNIAAEMKNTTTKLYASSNIQFGKEIFGQDTAIINHNNPESILIFIEGAGYPLFYIQSLENLKKAFYSEIDKDPTSIYKRYSTKHFGHLYDLLLPAGDKEFKTEIDSLELVIRAIVLGVIKYDERLSVFYFQDKDESFMLQRNNLGKSLRICARRINENSDYKRSILNSIDDIELDLAHYIELWQVCRKNKIQTAKYDLEIFGERTKDLISPLNYIFKDLVDEFQKEISNQKRNQGKTEEVIIAEFEKEPNPETINYPKINYYTEVIKDGIYYFAK